MLQLVIGIGEREKTNQKSRSVLPICTAEDRVNETSPTFYIIPTAHLDFDKGGDCCVILFECGVVSGVVCG